MLLQPLLSALMVIVVACRWHVSSAPLQQQRTLAGFQLCAFA
jgi:hypothetical protein